jgi:hypothetical protein
MHSMVILWHPKVTNMSIYIPSTWGNSTDNLGLCIQISRDGESSGGVGTEDHDLPGNIKVLTIHYNIQLESKIMGDSICMIIQPTNMSKHGPSL